MGIARNIARLVPNGSGLLPNANIEAVAASKLTGTVALATQVSGTLPDANAPSGSVLQVVSVTKTDVFSSTSSTPVAVTGLAATITPISTASKIFIMVSFNVGGDTPTANCDYYLYKNGSVISNAIGDASGSEQRSAAHYDPRVDRMNHPYMISHLDSPASTSALTYQLYQRSQPNYNFYINRGSYQDGNTGRTISTITLMEIAA